MAEASRSSACLCAHGGAASRIEAQPFFRRGCPALQTGPGPTSEEGEGRSVLEQRGMC